MLKTGNTDTPAQLQTLVKKLSVVIISQLLSFVPFTIFHFRATISHIQMFRKVLRCVIPTSVAHPANINRHHLCVKRFSKSVLLVSVTVHSFSYNVSSLGLKKLNEFFFSLHRLSLVILMILLCREETEYVPT